AVPAKVLAIVMAQLVLDPAALQFRPQRSAAGAPDLLDGFDEAHLYQHRMHRHGAIAGLFLHAAFAIANNIEYPDAVSRAQVVRVQLAGFLSAHPTVEAEDGKEETTVAHNVIAGPNLRRKELA